jgi:hypothetical protein
MEATYFIGTIHPTVETFLKMWRNKCWGDPSATCEGYLQQPPLVGFRFHDTLAYPKEVIAMFCRKPKVSKVSKRRL